MNGDWEHQPSPVISTNDNVRVLPIAEAIPLQELHAHHRSRAYWELRAEQVMDRVFEPLDANHTETTKLLPLPQPPPAQPLADQPQPQSPQRQGTTTILLIGLTALSIAFGLGAMLLWRHWLQAQQDLNQERQLQVLEKLRQIEPSISAPATATPPVADANWFDNLPPAPEPITVPVPVERPAAQAPPPALAAKVQPQPELPELLGIVQVPGKGGTAIFGTPTGSVTAGIGEPIGSSGWELQSLDMEQTLIRRDGLVRSLSISGR
jgi:hypothetical protein